MILEQFIDQINQNKPIRFDETMAVIAENYDYHPHEFSNGLGNDILINPAGTNEGSCKIFAFAQLHNLNELQTLNLFGDYYHLDVLKNPEEQGHQNIRNFIKYGWQGIRFTAGALTPKS